MTKERIDELFVMWNKPPAFGLGGAMIGAPGAAELFAAIDLLRRQRDYLARTADICARVVHCDYDPAGDTTEYEPDKEAVELFGEEAMYFVVGCGPTRTHYSLVTKELKP